MSLCLTLALLPASVLADGERAEGTPLVFFYITASATEGGNIYPTGQMMIQMGQSATYFITPNEGYQLTNVMIDGQIYGPIYTYTFDQVSSNHVILATFEPAETHESTLPQIPGHVDEPAEPGPADKLSDIQDHWAYGAIVSALEAGLFTGTSETTFSPDGPMTRGMFVSVLARLHGAEPIAEPENPLPFTDVDAGMYYHDAVVWAVQNGIVTGTSETTFSPEQIVNREQMATMILRYLNFIGRGPEADGETELSYVDLALISPYALEGVKYCSALGLFVGKLGNAFDPQGESTRAEAAEIFTRLQRLLAEA